MSLKTVPNNMKVASSGRENIALHNYVIRIPIELLLAHGCSSLKTAPNDMKVTSLEQTPSQSLLAPLLGLTGDIQIWE